MSPKIVLMPPKIVIDKAIILCYRTFFKHLKGQPCTMHHVNERHVVTVANELLRQPMNFTLSERRLLAMVLSTIKPSYTKLPDKVAQERFTVEQLKEMYWKQIVGDIVTSEDVFEITASNYAELFNISLSNAKEELKGAADRLYERSIVVVTETHKAKFRWVSSVVFDTGDNVARLRFSQEVLPYITGLQRNFTKIRLKHIVKLQSVYSWRLYELYRVSIGENHRVEPYFSLEELYSMLEVPASRRDYRKFKERILTKALAELKEENGFRLLTREKKEGRKVVGLWFKHQGELEVAA